MTEGLQVKTPRTPLLAEPAGYRTHMTLDLKRDRRAAMYVQVGFLVVGATFAASAVLLHLPLQSGWSTGTMLTVTLVACLIYMWLHEATHGLLMTALSGARSHYAVRLPYLTTGNPAFVSRRAFVVATLGPLVLWGAALLWLVTVMPADAFLTLYVLNALNVAGSVGDLYQARQTARLPRSALIRDDGRNTTVLVPQSWTSHGDTPLAPDLAARTADDRNRSSATEPTGRE